MAKDFLEIPPGPPVAFTPPGSAAWCDYFLREQAFLHDVTKQKTPWLVNSLPYVTNDEGKLVTNAIITKSAIEALIAAGPSLGGTVTSVSVVTANSLSGTVATATTTPAITLDIALFTSGAKGAVPLSGGGTANFLRADGTWQAPAGTAGITALTGDVTATGPGSVAATLATVNANVGSFTNANITVNAKGLITAASNGTAGTVTSVAVSGGTTGLTTSGGPITSSGTITFAGTLIAANGGTGFASYAVGDLLYASTTTVLSKLADVATGSALISGGVGVAPSWGKVPLTTSTGPAICCGRLTLASGFAIYDNATAIAVSGQNTTNDTITVTGAEVIWVVGTMVTSSATSGGLTAGTQYYVGNISTNTVSLFTTPANAVAGTPKVDITGTVTATITPNGVANTSVYFTPFRGSIIALYDGSAWTMVSFAEVSIALGTLTAAKNYDVFGYLSSGALALELSTAWTNDTTRADALALLNGIYVKNSDNTRRYLGTFRTVSTTATEDSFGGVVSQVGGKRFLWNYQNRLPRHIKVIDTTASWSYKTYTIRQANGATGNKVEFVTGISEEPYTCNVAGSVIMNAETQGPLIGIGLDSTTVNFGLGGEVFNSGATNVIGSVTSIFNALTNQGYHYFAWLERGGAGTTTTFFGVDDGLGLQSGLLAGIFN